MPGKTTLTQHVNVWLLIRIRRVGRPASSRQAGPAHNGSAHYPLLTALYLSSEVPGGPLARRRQRARRRGATRRPVIKGIASIESSIQIVINVIEGPARLSEAGCPAAAQRQVIPVEACPLQRSRLAIVALGTWTQRERERAGLRERLSRVASLRALKFMRGALIRTACSGGPYASRELVYSLFSNRAVDYAVHTRTTSSQATLTSTGQVMATL